jgi:hypothetical protein
MRFSFCSALLFIAVLTLSANAFAPTSGNHHHGLRTAKTASTKLDASKRREIFKWAKKAAVLGLGFKAASGGAATQPANAVVEALTGRVVTFLVNNLGGEEGKRGTFKIQLAPEWAPRGVARFEVRLQPERVL